MQANPTPFYDSKTFLDKFFKSKMEEHFVWCNLPSQ